MAQGMNTSTDWDHKDRKWNWSHINTKQINAFPTNFLWGFASSAYQFEGNCPNASWARWEQEQFDDQTPHVMHPCGNACNHWDRYKEDIQLLKQTGARAFRFSVEWSKIEPRNGEFNQEVLQHYEDVCKELVANGIKPVITLHHYTDPIWFMYDEGGFEKAQNIQYYVRFCTKVFERLHPYVHLWFTFNSPSGYATKGYLNGSVPPGKKDMQLMAEVLKNLLEAHVQTYHALKAINKKAQIGILKNIYRIEPANRYNPLDRIGSMLANYITNDSIYDFFNTGRFQIRIPGKVHIDHTNLNALSSLDFIGLNYYSHGYMSNFNTPTTDSNETPTQNPMYSLYPEGIYHAIKELHKKIARPLRIPIYITENGVATDDANVRNEHAERYLYAISQAINDGYDVRGYIHWALLDNYEWGTYDKHYGIYAVDFKTQERTLKPGTGHLLTCIKNQRYEKDFFA
jgi:beta-glucosidase